MSWVRIEKENDEVVRFGMVRHRDRPSTGELAIGKSDGRTYFYKGEEFGGNWASAQEFWVEQKEWAG